MHITHINDYPIDQDFYSGTPYWLDTNISLTLIIYAYPFDVFVLIAHKFLIQR